MLLSNPFFKVKKKKKSNPYIDTLGMLPKLKYGDRVWEERERNTLLLCQTKEATSG